MSDIAPTSPYRLAFCDYAIKKWRVLRTRRPEHRQSCWRGQPWRTPGGSAFSSITQGGGKRRAAGVEQL